MTQQEELVKLMEVVDTPLDIRFGAEGIGAYRIQGVVSDLVNQLEKRRKATTEILKALVDLHTKGLN